MVNLGGLHPAERVLLADQLLPHHVDRDLDRRRRRALGSPGLEHVELAALDGELHVLHVAVVLLQPLRDLGEVAVHLRQGLLQSRDRLGGADPGDDVLSLGVKQVLTKDATLPGRRVAGERHPGARVLPHVAEDHGLNVDGGAEIVRDVVVLAVGDRATAVPGIEDRRYRLGHLVPGVLGKRLTGVLLHDGVELSRELLECPGAEVGIGRGLGRLLGLLQLGVEQLHLDAEHDPAVHLNEAAVGVEGEAPVPGLGGQAL